VSKFPVFLYFSYLKLTQDWLAEETQKYFKWRRIDNKNYYKETVRGIAKDCLIKTGSLHFS